MNILLKYNLFHWNLRTQVQSFLESYVEIFILGASTFIYCYYCHLLSYQFWIRNWLRFILLWCSRTNIHTHLTLAHFRKFTASMNPGSCHTRHSAEDKIKRQPDQTPLQKVLESYYTWSKKADHLCITADENHPEQYQQLYWSLTTLAQNKRVNGTMGH